VAARAAARKLRGPAYSWLDRPLQERCLLYHGTPPCPTGYNNNYQIAQTPDTVAIRYEMLAEVRVIPLDNRPHLQGDLKQWMGSPLESSDMSINWKKSLSARGRESDPQEYPSRSYGWQPRWNARLRNGMDTSLNLSLSGETQESAGQGALERRSTNVTLRLDKQFDAQGRLSFLRFGQTGVGSTIDMTLSIGWGNSASWREQDGIRSQERTSTRISVDPQFTYQFTRNLRGSLRLQYSRVAQTVSTTQSLGMFFDVVLNF